LKARLPKQGKSIADVLGHRCIDTTFIYAKADLKAFEKCQCHGPRKSESMATVFFPVLWPFGFNHFLRRATPLLSRGCGYAKKLFFTWIAFWDE
jgi:hypothetical protein